jgi:hypothetical protein
MSSEFDGLVIVKAGPSAYQRALLEAARLYGPDVQLDQVGWDEDTVTFLIEDSD